MYFLDDRIIARVVNTVNAFFIMDISPLCNQEVFDYYYNISPKQRKEKSDRFKLNEDKARSIGAYALLRFAVSDHTEFDLDKLEILTDKNGKPFVKENPFYFSISHSGKYAVCALSDSPVGIDIELKKEFSPKFKDRFAENTLDWTKKEAKGKLTGNGFFDKTPDNFVYTHKKTDGYIITVCSDKTFEDFYTYHLPFPT